MRSSKGSVLVNILVVSAILTVLIGGLLSVIKNSQERSRNFRRKQNFLNIVDSIRAGLEDPHVCYLMLAGQTININPGGVNQNLRIDLLTALPGKPASRYVQAGWKSPNDDFEMNRVTILTLTTKSYKGSPSTGVIDPRVINFDRPLNVDNPLRSYRARIYFDPKQLPGENELWKLNMIEARCRYRDSNPEYFRINGTLNSTVCSPGAQGTLQPFAANPTNPITESRYVINLIVNVNPGTGRIYACHGEKSVASVCEDAGGSYDATAIHETFGGGSMVPFPEFRCQPNYRCWPEPQSAILGGVRKTAAPPLPNPATPPACPWPYRQPDWVGRTGGSDIWVCTWCNNNKWIPGSQ